ncbi:MAG: T9SS type A sorting domain-containing protein [Flavobacteriales bacterium]|nr:T9SS type A sorting domain-containing protein [Flavobacteriales bacterium]
MKKTLLVGVCLGLTVAGVAQSGRSLPEKRVAGPTITRPGVHHGSADRVVIWSDDLSSASTWTLGQDPGAFDLDWEIGVGLENTGSYPTAPIESTTAANGYAMLDSDGANNTSGTEESAHMTTATSIDLSSYSNVVLEFENHYRKFPPEACYAVVSTDGTFPLLSSSTDISGMPNVFRLFANLATNESTTNPETVSLDISSIAGGQSTVWIRFHWTGAYGYSWFLDDVSLIEQQPYDLVMNYGVISHTGNGDEYGRVPVAQLNPDMNFGAEILNFGSLAQTGLQVQVLVTDAASATVIDQTFTLGDLASGATVSLDEMVTLPAIGVGIYDVRFEVTSNEGGSEVILDNNVVNRQFGVDNDRYALDGIGVYDDNALLGIGSESFTGAEDGLEVMTYYEFAANATVHGVEAILANGTLVGSAVIVSLYDTTTVLNTPASAASLSNPIAQSDVIEITQADLDAGRVVGLFIAPANIAPGGYYCTVRLLSQGNLYPITILDDNTVPQPGNDGLIFIPNDNVFGNGNAPAVRAVLNPSVGISEAALEGVGLFPNPTTGVLRLSTSYTGSHTIEVMDLLGARVMSERINGNGTIDLTGMAKGLYLVRVSNDKGSLVQRVALD